MNFIKKHIHIFYLLFSVILSVVYFRDYIDAILLGINNFIVKCSDFGQYAYEAKTYVDNAYFIDSIDFGKEPGLFIVIAQVARMLSLDPKTAYLFVDFITNILRLLIVGLLTEKISKNKTYGLLAIVLTGTNYLITTTYILLISRQLFATTFLLLLVYLNIIEKGSKKIYLLMGIFLGMAIMGHRVSLIIGSIGIILGGVLGFANTKKINFSYGYILILGILLAGPYLYLEIPGLIDTLKFIGGRKDSGVFISNLTPWQENELGSRGFSYFSNSTTDQMPLLHYLSYQSFIVIGCIFFISKAKKVIFNNIFFGGLLLVLTIYSLLKITFSIRILVSLVFLLVPILTYGILFLKNKILIMTLYLMLSIVSLNGTKIPTIMNNRILEKDTSIKYIEENFNKQESQFLIERRCSGDDQLAQVGFLTGVNISNKKYKNTSSGKSDENNNLEILHYYQTQDLVRKNAINLLHKPYLHELFKDKKNYIAYGRGISAAEALSLKNGTHRAFAMPYLKLIYKNTTNKDQIINYIFEVDIKNVDFFTNLNYLNRNLESN